MADTRTDNPRHVTIVGAGIVGICSAAWLQRSGHQVTVIDRVDPGFGTSFGNAGSISPSAVLPVATPGMLKKVPGWLLDALGPLTIRWRYLPFMLPWLMRFLHHGQPSEVRRIASAMSALMTPTFECYEPLVKHAACEALIRRTGCLYVYESEQEFAEAGRGITLRQELGATLEAIGEDEMRQLEPALGRQFKLGLWAPDNGRTTDPQALVGALAEQVIADGGTILKGEVQAVELGENGPERLRTTGGDLDVDMLLLAAGAWSRKLAGQLGFKVPLETQRGYHATLPDAGIEVNRTVMWTKRSVFVNPMDVGLRFAGTVELAGLDAEPDYRRAEKLVQLGQQMFPDMQVGEPSYWMGHRPCLPDSLPVIDRPATMPDVMFAFGHQHVGMCCGAPTGTLIAELADGKPSSIDLSPFRVDRFS